ncbi:PAS domain S-box protein, partial [bacterium]|nr:PAS domain S-box protein [bacterium]
KLKENEQWLSTLLQSIGEGVIATDIDGNITFLNPVAELVTGWKKDAVMQKELHEVFNVINEITGKRSENPLKEILKEGISIGSTNHSVLISKGGKKVPIDYNAAPIRDERGNIDGIVLVFKDITERQRIHRVLRENEEKYRTLFNRIVDPVFIFDKENRFFLDCNDAVEEVYGYSRAELESMTPFDLHPEEEAAKVERNLNVKSLKKPFVYQHIKKNGQMLPVEIRSHEIDYQGRPAWFCIVRDISDRKKAEEVLNEQNRFNELKAKIWQIAASRSFENEYDLIQELLNTIGAALKVSRATYMPYDPRRKSFVAKLQWREKDVESSMGEGIQLEKARHFSGKRYIEIPKDIDLLIGDMPLKKVIKKYASHKLKKRGIYSCLMVAHGDADDPRGIFSFSDCKRSRDWS